MRSRRVEIRKQPTLTIETNTQDLDFFQLKKHVHARLFAFSSINVND